MYLKKQKSSRTTVQTGAYLVKANAEEQFTKVKKAGFDTYMVKSGLMYKIQVGAYSKKENADVMLAKIKKAGFDAFITTSAGTAVTPTANTPKEPSIAEGDKVIVLASASKYYTGQDIPDWVKGQSYTVLQIEPDKYLLKEIISWVKKSDVKRV